MRGVCLSVHSHVSETTSTNFTNVSVHATCRRRLVLDNSAVRYVLPVLWTTSRFRILRVACRAATSSQNFQRIRQGAPGCLSSYIMAANCAPGTKTDVHDIFVYGTAFYFFFSLCIITYRSNRLVCKSAFFSSTSSLKRTRQST